MKEAGGGGEGLLVEMKTSKDQVYTLGGKWNVFPFNLALVSLERILRKSSCSRAETALAVRG